jgi:Flp pilus assembly protein TadG
VDPRIAGNDVKRSSGESGARHPRAIANRRHVREARGQTMVEFAIVLPLIALALFACLKVGLGFFTYEDVASAANAGARAAAVNHGADPTAVARQAAKSIAPTVGLTDSEISVTYISTSSPPGPSWSYPGTVTVTVSHPLTFSFLGLLPQDFNLSATATKRLER